MLSMTSVDIQQKTTRYGRVRRRRPIFPWGYPHSIVGAEELNYRVRDGNGCTLFAKVTNSPAHPSGLLTRFIIHQSYVICQPLFCAKSGRLQKFFSNYLIVTPTRSSKRRLISARYFIGIRLGRQWESEPVLMSKSCLLTYS